ncbi:MAG: EAL domain-containing protein [Candidatus Contendobacter sp.]|jgi:diguanylate cyclase (GGDEF)-like protein/PAS domain S-box-containing protein|nr:EAL domain-containing protein [Candidatus Contendobacter sp.]
MKPIEAGVPSLPVVLLIEDERGDAELIRWQLLEKSDTAFDVAMADSLAAGQQLIDKGDLRPDVVLLDLNLPDSSGIQTVERCRLLTDAPIVVLTGNDEKRLAFAALEAGAQDYLVKGQFDPDALARAVRYARVRGQLEHRLAHSARLYAALSQCNQAIVRVTDEPELLLEVCRIAVEFGGMKMAWIGLIDARTRQVYPVVSFGAGTDYLQGIDISIDADQPTGCGPIGMAIRSQAPVWIQDFYHDPDTAPWHERGARFGWRSVAALPLSRKGAVIGSFALYAHEFNAFDKAARKLLLEMSTDISFALDNFTREAERRQAEAIILNERDFTRAALDSLPGLFYLISEQGQFLRWNRNFETASGYSADEIAGMTPLEFFAEAGKALIAAAIEQVFTQGETLVEAEFLSKDRTRTPYLFTGQRFEFEQQPCLIGMGIDITQRKQADERVQWLSHFDTLTGLANLHLLSDRFNHAIGMARCTQRTLTLMVLDLDHFKNINDTLGRYIGDAMLVEVARRIQSVVQAEDTVSRQGGDEFVLLLPTTDANGAAHIAQKMLETIAGDYQIDAHELAITPSVGIALYPADGEDFETLTKNADMAMYRAKRDGRNCYRFFAAEMQVRSTRILQLESALRRAQERRQLTLHYQPQVSLRDGRIIGAEALLRWRHFEFGPVSPAEFIPIAEASGQIVQMGEWVLRTAVRQMKIWLDQGLVATGAGGAPMVMAVNLSVIQFRHPRLIEQVMQILAEEGLPPQCLELELTEGVALNDPIGAIAVMNALHAQGIRMSIDDFGTGYSSLSYLKQFKAYKLKIDQSFVRNITDNPEDKAIVSAILSMARRLGLQTIAEGVETEGQLAFLRESGCDEVQGYYFSKPLPVAEFEGLLATRRFFSG